MIRGKKLLLVLLAACLLPFLMTACAETPAAPDGRLITGDPRPYLLNPVDFPNGNAYYMPENQAFMIPNETAIQAFGKEKGEMLIKDEERVVGWRVHYQASRSDQPGPQVYLATIVQHQSAKGAQIAVEKYNNALLFPEGGWKIEPDGPKVGDLSVTITGASKDEQGSPMMNYRIEYAYRNMSVDILVFGPEKEVTLDMAKSAATAVLLKLKTAELGRGPIPTQGAGYK